MAAATEKINLVRWVKWAPKQCEHACLGSHRTGGPKAQRACLSFGVVVVGGPTNNDLNSLLALLCNSFPALELGSGG